MNLTVSQAQGRVPVTVLCVEGDLDGSNFKQLIAKGQELYAAGVRDLLLDLGDMRYMSSAGLVALHSIALLMQGQQPVDPDAGWGSFRAIGRDREMGLQQHIKLLSPQPVVDKSLRTVGFDQFFEIYTDLAAAVASF